MRDAQLSDAVREVDRLATELAEARAMVAVLREACEAGRDAMRGLIAAADHMGSSIYDWERLIPEKAEEARRPFNKLDAALNNYASAAASFVQSVKAPLEADYPALTGRCCGRMNGSPMRARCWRGT